MAKSKATTTQKTTRKTATHPVTRVTETGKINGKTSVKNTGGVVAYTKGSRFKDAEVLEVVQRILSES